MRVGKSEGAIAGDKPSRHRIKKTTRDKVHRFGKDEELEPLLCWWSL